MRTLLVLAFAVCVCVAPAAQKGSGTRNQPQAKQSATTLNGVLDQSGDDYILKSEDSMTTQAVLRAQGFSADNFARFVGMRVEARGELVTEGERRVLVVRSLDHLKQTGPGGTQK